MMYYEAVYEAKCCGHTICDECACGLLECSGSFSVADATEPSINKEATQSPSEDDCDTAIPLTPSRTATVELPIDCPFCRQHGLGLKVITPGEAGDHLRNYDDSPGTALEDGTPGSSRRSAHTPSGSFQVKPSPLKIGDSFEKMMAKMVPLEDQPAAPGTSGRTAVPAGRPPRPPAAPTTPGVRHSRDGAVEGTPIVATPVFGVPVSTPGASLVQNTGVAAGAVSPAPVPEEDIVAEDDASPRLAENDESDTSSPQRNSRVEGSALETPGGRIDIPAVTLSQATPIGAQPMPPAAVQAVA